MMVVFWLSSVLLTLVSRIFNHIDLLISFNRIIVYCNVVVFLLLLNSKFF